MKKNIAFLGALLICGLSYSQVGINTNTPQATLDVVGKPANTSTLDGILSPVQKSSATNVKKINTILYVCPHEKNTRDYP